MRILGVNAVFHDPAAALVVDGEIVAAAEEERFSRRKHGKQAVPFSTWEVPEAAARWCLDAAGLRPEDLDAVAYSYDPDLAPQPNGDITADGWEGLRTLYARRAPLFLSSALPGLAPERVRFVAHHVAHAASCHLAAPHPSSAVLVADGRGERASMLAGHARDGALEVLAEQRLPHSLGLLYEEATEHLGFRRSSDEYKVMALAAYGRPRHLDRLRTLVRVEGLGVLTDPVPWAELSPRRTGGDDGPVDEADADLASSVQTLVEEVLLELARRLHRATGEEALVMAGGVALNCVANSRIAEEGPFRHVWVQPAAGDSGTALGAALHVAYDMGDHVRPMGTAALGRGWDDAAIEDHLRRNRVAFTRPADLPAAVADVIAAGGVVAWFQGRSEFGPRALGRRSLLASATRPDMTDRLNAVKGRERFRPVAPMVHARAAAEILEGPLPSPYMLFVHRVREHWRDRIPAACHIDGTARAQTVDPDSEPLVARLLDEVERREGVPVVVNTSLNTGGRPMVDDPRC
jgi:carbamoyltransferase